jgi:hypothetical protein
MNFIASVHFFVVLQHQFLADLYIYPALLLYCLIETALHNFYPFSIDYQLIALFYGLKCLLAAIWQPVDCLYSGILH